MVGAFGGGPEEVEGVFAVEGAGVEGIEGGAEVAGFGVVFGVGGDGGFPVVDGGEAEGAVEFGAGEFDAGGGATGAAK